MESNELMNRLYCMANIILGTSLTLPILAKLTISRPSLTKSYLPKAILLRFDCMDLDHNLRSKV